MARHSLILIFLLWLSLPASAVEDWSATIATSANSWSNVTKVRFKNNASRLATVAFADSSGAPVMSAPIKVVNGLPTTLFDMKPLEGGSYITVPANSTVERWVFMRLQAGSPTFTGSYNVTWAWPMIISYTSPVVNKTHAGAVAMNWIMNVAPGVGTVFAPNPKIFATFEFNDDPVVGSIRVTPNFSGPYTLRIGSVDISMTAINGVQGAWTTATPANYASGAVVKIIRNGRDLMVASLIKSPDGSFDMEFIMDPDDALEPPQLDEYTATSDTPGTAPGQSDDRGEISGAKPTTNLGGPAGAGAQASTDSSAADTVSDMYRAVREGVADAISGDVNTGPAPDTEKIENPAASSAVSQAKGVVDDNPFGSFGPGSLVGPTYGVNNSLSLGWFGGRTMTIYPASWAPTMKTLLNWMLAVGVLLTLTRMIRSAFV